MDTNQKATYNCLTVENKATGLKGDAKMAKAKKQKIEIVGRKLTITYPTIKKSVEFALYAFPEGTPQLTVDTYDHGAKQRVGDLESGGSPQEKYEAALKLKDAWAEGKWELARTPSDNSALVIEAVCQMKGLEVEDVTAELEEMDEEERAKKVLDWKSNAKVKATMLKILADRAAKVAAESDDDIEV